MKSELLTHEIDSVYQKFGEWRSISQALESDCASLIEEVIRQFSNTIEEMVVAYEDLEQINAGLIQTQMITGLDHQRYKGLFENAPLGYLILDRVGEIQDCNATACKLLQSPREMLVGQSLMEMIDERGQRQLFSFLSLHAKTGVDQDVEIHLKRTHPAWEGILLRIAGTSDPNRPPSEIWVSVHDLSREV